MRMRYHAAISIDGFIATSDGAVDWLHGFDPGEAGFSEFFPQIRGLVMGRTTFDQCLSFDEWPYGELPLVVITSRDLPKNAPASAIRCDANPQRALELLREAGVQGDVWNVGGAACASLFMEAGLIDRVEFAVLPMLLGSGISPFAPLSKFYRLQLESVRELAHGVLWQSYDCARHPDVESSARASEEVPCPNAT